MSEGPAGEDGRSGDGGDADNNGSGYESDADDLSELYYRDKRGDGEGDGFGGSDFAGPGLTEPERELADELNRTRELERTRDRFERFARDRDLGGGRRGVAASDDDAMAIIDAAERFGLEARADDSDEAAEEREKIAEALAQRARQPEVANQYKFYAVITKQATIKQNVVLTLEVPWEHRHQVFKALETMPFTAMVTMDEVTVD